MSTAIGRLFHQARKAQGMSFGDVARRAGYRNVAKGANKLVTIERGENPFPRPELRERFAPALGVSADAVFGALCEDFERLDRDVPPEVIVRMIPGVLMSLKLPDGCTVREAIDLAKQYSAEYNVKVCVTFSNIRGLYIRPDGSSFESYGLPSSTFRGFPGGFLDAKLCSKQGRRLQHEVAGTPIE